jgi:hypothetical protein
MRGGALLELSAAPTLPPLPDDDEGDEGVDSGLGDDAAQREGGAAQRGQQEEGWGDEALEEGDSGEGKEPSAGGRSRKESSSECSRGSAEAAGGAGSEQQEGGEEGGAGGQGSTGQCRRREGVEKGEAPQKLNMRVELVVPPNSQQWLVQKVYTEKKDIGLVFQVSLAAGAGVVGACVYGMCAYEGGREVVGQASGHGESPDSMRSLPPAPPSPPPPLHSPLELPLCLQMVGKVLMDVGATDGPSTPADGNSEAGKEPEAAAADVGTVADGSKAQQHGPEG